ncbi:MAG: hypothetical protein ABSG53_00125 [Thermoguttaceae bacterium]|jgi:hypothetical protein
MSGPYHIHNSSPCSDDGNGHWIVCGIGYIHKLCDAGDGRRGKRIARRLAKLANEVHSKAIAFNYTVGDMDLDPGVRFEIGENRVSLLIDGESALEYNHPDPLAVLAMIRVIRVLQGNAFGDNRREAIVHWGHGIGHVDGLHQRTTFTHRSLLPTSL